MQLLAFQSLIESEADEGRHIATPGPEHKVCIVLLGRHERGINIIVKATDTTEAASLNLEQPALDCNQAVVWISDVP